MLLNLSTTVVEEGRLYTLLHVASSNRQLGIIAWLLTQVSNSERRKFVNSMDREGDTALHYSGGLESARFLVETAYINVHIQNEVGMTALETKQWELNTTMQEESFSEADQDYVDLKETVEYLQWVIASEPVEKS